VALDKFLNEPEIPLPNILQTMNAKPHAYTAPIAILIFHPIAEEAEFAGQYIANATEALIQHGFHVCIGMPNTDPGNFNLVKCLESLSEKESVTFYGNVSRNNFVNLFRHARMMVGNSSAGILEAASLKVPVINIGLRQRGRPSGCNVIFVDGDFDSISAAVGLANSDDFRLNIKTSNNPYGDGHSAERASAFLKSLDFGEYLKKPEDPLHAYR
jgi:UDP-N-acetylglucosamine 2-epimerase